MTWTLLLDITIALLLAAALVFAARFNRKLDTARRDWATLKPLAADFQEATVRVEEGIGRLKVSTEALAAESERARTLTDDLRYLIERAETAATRLENGIRASRSQEAATPRIRPMARAGRAGDSGDEPEPPTAEPVGASSKAARGAATTGAMPPARPAATKPAARSQAERALLEALRAGE